jgi:hypothetical protein
MVFHIKHAGKVDIERISEFWVTHVLMLCLIAGGFCAVGIFLAKIFSYVQIRKLESRILTRSI